MKKTVSQILMIIGAFVAIIGIIIDAFILEQPITAFNIIDLSTIAAIFALAFVFGKKESLVKIGYVIAAVLGACALTQILIPTEIVVDEGIYGSYVETESNFTVSGLGFLSMGLAALVFYFVQLLKAFGFVRAGKEVTSTDVVAVLNKYKDMEKENIITEEEFVALKGKILSSASKEVSSVEDLKKWKKLFDQKVITEEEFTSIKSKIFSK